MYCQLLYLRGCLPGRIRHALAELPETLDETYERALREIKRANWELAHRLFQSVAVAARPLRVEELAEFLAFDFDAGSTPRFDEGWHLEDPIHAVQSACPSFLSVIDIGGHQIIQFSHFSVKEFLTSSRLSESNHEISRYHVSMTPAHTLVVKACLGILLHLDKNVAEVAVQKFPLASYAALHWVDHARFEDVSQNVENGIHILFDSNKHHLTIWVSLHNKELPSWRLFKRDERPLPLSGTPLHYATTCGLHAFVNLLVVEHPHDVNSRGLDNLTPLHMASLRGYEEVAHVLLENDADVTAQDDDGQTPLHVASREGHSEVVRTLLGHGASTADRDKAGLTPLHLALQPRNVEDPHNTHGGVDGRAKDEGENGHAQLRGALQNDYLSYLFSQEAIGQVIRDPFERRRHTTLQGRTLFYVALCQRYASPLRFHDKAGVDTRDKGKWNHLAPRSEHVEVALLLLKHGADPGARNERGSRPLHLASLSGFMEIVQFLIEHGVDRAAQDNDGRTPLHFASENGHVGVARYLVKHGADQMIQDKSGWTPLDLASKGGHIEVVRYLVEHGTGPTVQNKNGLMALHKASQGGHIEVVRYLVEHGTDPTIQDKYGWTPLHLASLAGHIEVVRYLVEHGTDPTVQDKDGWTPLHPASLAGHIEVVRYLVEHGTDPTVQDEDGWTPLHLASQDGHIEVVRYLVEHGTDSTVQNKKGSMPLHKASGGGHIEVMRYLVEHGTDPTAQDNHGWTPLHDASQGGHIEVVRYLVELGADPTVLNKDGWNPLDLASQGGHIEVVPFLVEHGSSPSHLAPQDEHVEVAQFLINHGADPIAQANVGKLCGIWRRTKDILKLRRSSSLTSNVSRVSSSTAAHIQ